jgi:streptomycin 6-kinase
MSAMRDELAPWLLRWGLTPDGDGFVSPYSGNILAPVRRDDTPAMLKLARSAREQLGGQVMAWWDGQGAAPVLAQDGEALLLLRGTDTAQLVAMAHDGRDEAATRILCGVVAGLHAPGKTPPPEGLKTLDELFRALREAADRDVRFAKGWGIAGPLLADPRDVVVLHGDVHHRNVLDFGARGWLAIDGWGVWGERGYDYANIARNPDLETASKPGRMRRQVELIAEMADLEIGRQLCWTAAHAYLSAAWCVEDGIDASPAFQLAQIATSLL